MVTRKQLLFRAGQLAALFAMACLGLFDVASGGILGDGLGLLKVLAAIGTAVVFLRPHRPGSRRLPVSALVLALVSLLLTLLSVAVSQGSIGYSYGLAETAGLFAVIFVVARRGEPQWSIGALLALGMAVGFIPLRTELGYQMVVIGLIQGLIAAAAIGAGVYLRIIETNRSRAMDAVRAEQRAEFARDLHDFIAHHVTGIVVQAQGARYIAEQDPKRAAEALERIEAAGAETMASMRRMVGVLRDPSARPDAPLAPLAGIAELGALVTRFNEVGGPYTRLHTDGDLEGLAVEVSTSAYRVVMEALTNVRRHAQQARVADVWIRRTQGWLLVRVSNDGPPPGAAPRGEGGYGLVGLQERVRTLGGRITSGPGIDGGWVVDAALPVS